MQYKILTVGSVLSLEKALQKLEKLVNEKIGLGWEPLGGVSVTDHQVAQAVIKRR